MTNEVLEVCKGISWPSAVVLVGIAFAAAFAVVGALWAAR